MILDDCWIKTLGFSKTQAVVLNSLKQRGISDDFRHVVWLDNLFTSARLLTVLRELEFEAAGTECTTKTKREEHEEKEGELAQKKQKEKNRGLDLNLSDLKLKHEAQLDRNKLYETISSDEQVLQIT